jgi:AcrR family transcriptional regulator
MMSEPDIILARDVSCCNQIGYDGRVGRWEPNARGRLEQAAMELFQTRGYDRTTVEEIAARAGLTERTFFRYFADKREVLFGGAKDLERLIVGAIANGPRTAAPFEAVLAALEATAPFFESRRSYARKRRSLMAAHAELRERELIKLASLATAIADSLRDRGVANPVAELMAEAGIAIFKNAFERWAADKSERDLAQHIRMTLDDLKAVAASTNAPSRSRTGNTGRRKPPGRLGPA